MRIASLLLMMGLLSIGCASECERKASDGCGSAKAISESAFDSCVEAAAAACEQLEKPTD